MPASFSEYWLQEELRTRLGFDGAIFSDDLTMKATRDYGSMSERARLALEAGCDMVIICNDRAAARTAVTSLRDYSNPLSLVRFARLHGTKQVDPDALTASEEWQAASAALERWSKPGELKLDA
jgi:beta-N-acetylhexosaminidase